MTEGSDQLRVPLFQYETVRTESDQTRREQQSILTWNQAFAVALFGVGAISIGMYHRNDIGGVVFGLVIPLVLMGGALAWAGELIRMERTGVFLRALERSTWLRDQGGSVDTRWLIWENFLWSPPERLVKVGYRKQNVGYIGVALFYVAMLLGSLVVFWNIAPAWIAALDTVALCTVNIVIMSAVAIRIFRLASFAPSIGQEELATWTNGLPELVSADTQIPIPARVRSMATSRLRSRIGQ